MEPRVHKTILDNGFRVISEKVPHVHSVSIGLWVLAGTADETPANNGIAHFLEHMVFKGTKSRDTLALADSLESLGGSLNAYTSKEYTCYYAHVLDEHLEVAVDVLADMILNSKFSKKDILMEKDVVQEEIAELDENPGDLVHEYFIQSLYRPHPLSYSILGTKSSLSNITRQDLIDFLDHNYTANRMIIAAVGNLGHTQLVDLVCRYFDSVRGYSERNTSALENEKPEKTILKSGFHQAHLCMGRRAFNYTDPRRYDLIVLNTILGAGMSSRLFQNVREQHGLAYSIYSFIDFLKDSGLFGIYLGTDHERLDFAIDLVLKEFSRLQNHPVPDDELQKRKNQLKGNLLLGLEGTSSRMDRLAKMEIYRGRVIPIDETIRAIESVTEKRILELAYDLLDEKHLYSTILKPLEPSRGITKKAG